MNRILMVLKYCVIMKNRIKVLFIVELDVIVVVEIDKYLVRNGCFKYWDYIFILILFD